MVVNSKNSNAFSLIGHPKNSICNRPIDKNKEYAGRKSIATSANREASNFDFSAYDDLILANLKDYYNNEETLIYVYNVIFDFILF